MDTRTNLHSGWYPGGSYTQTCEDIEYQPETARLSANCIQRNGVRNFSEIYLPYSYDDIQNCDGILTLNDCA
jgi:hypothetical protein